MAKVLSKELIAALDNRRKTLVGRIAKAARKNVPYLMAIAGELQRIELKLDPSKHSQNSSSEEE